MITVEGNLSVCNLSYGFKWNVRARNRLSSFHDNISRLFRLLLLIHCFCFFFFFYFFGGFVNIPDKKIIFSERISPSCGECFHRITVNLSLGCKKLHANIYLYIYVIFCRFLVLSLLHLFRLNVNGQIAFSPRTIPRKKKQVKHFEYIVWNQYTSAQPFGIDRTEYIGEP